MNTTDLSLNFTSNIPKNITEKILNSKEQQNKLKKEINEGVDKINSLSKLDDKSLPKLEDKGESSKINKNTNDSSIIDIIKNGKKLVLKQGLYRLARLATKKTNSIFVIPIGIAYSKTNPNLGDTFCLSFGQPILMNDNLNLSIEVFNSSLSEKMINAEKIALKNVGR